MQILHDEILHDENPGFSGMRTHVRAVGDHVGREASELYPPTSLQTVGDHARQVVSELQAPTSLQEDSKK